MRRELSRIRLESAGTESRTFANPSRICKCLRKITTNLTRMRVGTVSRHPWQRGARWRLSSSTTASSERARREARAASGEDAQAADEDGKG
eukprot:1867546-Prymnesium_polylepis.1